MNRYSSPEGPRPPFLALLSCFVVVVDHRQVAFFSFPRSGADTGEPEARRGDLPPGDVAFIGAENVFCAARELVASLSDCCVQRANRAPLPLGLTA